LNLALTQNERTSSPPSFLREVLVLARPPGAIDLVASFPQLSGSSPLPRSHGLSPSHCEMWSLPCLALREHLFLPRGWTTHSQAESSAAISELSHDGGPDGTFAEQMPVKALRGNLRVFFFSAKLTQFAPGSTERDTLWVLIVPGSRPASPSSVHLPVRLFLLGRKPTPPPTVSQSPDGVKLLRRTSKALLCDTPRFFLGIGAALPANEGAHVLERRTPRSSPSPGSV